MLKKILTGIIVFIGILVVIYVVLALLSKPAESHVYFEEGDGLWPSNTMFAMEQAAEMGVDVLEMDIHQTADGTLVVMHDETVDRTTDGNGQIKEMTLAELKELDAGHNWTDDDGQT